MILVLGAPDPVAIRLMEFLTEKGILVATVLDPEARGECPESVKVYSGDAAGIDFGLPGPKYKELLSDVAELALVETGSRGLPNSRPHGEVPCDFRSRDSKPRDSNHGDVENSRAVRTAAEVTEFVRAGGARGGVRFLSSLLVFGGATGRVTESDFHVGQSFRDIHEESLAVAEKLILSVKFRCPLSIVRTAPILGDEVVGSLFSGAAFRLLREIESAPLEKSYVFSEHPIRFDTVERVARALLKVAPRNGGTVIHLVDSAPPTDSQLIEWLSTRVHKRAQRAELGPFLLQGARPWSHILKGYPGARALSGWDLTFERKNAQALCPELLDRNDFEILDRLISGQGQVSE